MKFDKAILYIMDSSGRRSMLGDIFDGSLEVDTCSPNEVPDMYYSLTDSANVSFEMTLENLNCLTYKPFEPARMFDIEHDVPISVQSKWHKKKRINKKWLKRYGMEFDTVKMKAKARRLGYDIETGRLDFEVDELEYMWRSHQLRKYLKIEIGGRWNEKD